jgi:hypothetical protein
MIPMKTELKKDIHIQKITDEAGVSRYQMETSPVVDRDELVGILSFMIQTIATQPLPTLQPDKKKRDDYIG